MKQALTPIPEPSLANGACKWRTYSRKVIQERLILDFNFTCKVACFCAKALKVYFFAGYLTLILRNNAAHSYSSSRKLAIDITEPRFALSAILFSKWIDFADVYSSLAIRVALCVDLNLSEF